MDTVRNDEVGMKGGMEKELARRADQKVLRWLDMWKEWISTVWLARCWWM